MQETKSKINPDLNFNKNIKKNKFSTLNIFSQFFFINQ